MTVLENTQQLTGASDQRAFVRLAASGQAPVEGNQCRVPAKRGRQRGGVERAPEPRTAAADMGLALTLAALLDERRQAGQGGGLLAADLSKLRHAHDQRERGARADAGNTQHKREPLGQVGMRAQFGGQALQLGGATLVQAHPASTNVGGDRVPQPPVRDMLEAGAEAGDIVFDLLDIGKMIRQRVIVPDLVRASTRNGTRFTGSRRWPGQARPRRVT